MDPLAKRPWTTTPTTITSVIIDTKTPYPQDLIKDATATAHFLFLIPPHKPSLRRKPETTWKTLKMLRKKKRGTRYPSTTGKTHSTLTPTPRMTKRLLPRPAPTIPDHDYTSDDRNDDFDAVLRNHAFDNDFDLDMHEPGD
jgi:hypothetical protein